MGRIHLHQLFILNDYAARYAVARHYLGLVDVDDNNVGPRLYITCIFV